MSSSVSDDFKKAVAEDESAEFDFGPNNKFTLMTDWEGDGEFKPNVLVKKSDVEYDDVNRLEQEVDDYLQEFISFRAIEFDEQNSNESLYVFYIHNADKNSV